VVLRLDDRLLGLELLDLETLSLSRGLGGLSVPQDTLDATLFLLVFGLCAFPDAILAVDDMPETLSSLPGREGSLGSRQLLSPRLSLLGGLLVLEFRRRSEGSWRLWSE
jgi:hypothetical protein